jgi:dolichol-phosphate mannosyltransferase
MTKPLELSVVVPTLNESENIPAVVARLEETLKGIEWEVIFVDDDSDDGTADQIRRIGRVNRRVRCLQRIGRRGLSGACIEGMLASPAPYLAVMDADLQHDEALLPRMLEVLKADEADVVIGSRYMEGGGFGEWAESRRMISRFATGLGGLVMKTRVSDPMSGFFMLRKDAFHRSVRKLSGIGFKILLDILASSPRGLRVKELPFEFRTRLAGESKLDSMVAWEYVMMLLDKLIGHLVPIRFVLFSMVGLFGLGVHLGALWIAHKGFDASFPLSQGIATMVAMTNNFVLNNMFTYRDKRLRGWSFLLGLLSFYAVCGIGAVANIGIASYVYGVEEPWWVAGVTGALVGAVWNYAVSSVYTWRNPKKA